jgi:hypothetical protein
MTYLAETSRSLDSAAAKPVIASGNLVRRAVKAGNSSDEVLSGVVYERDHSPSATESPQDQLGICTQRPVIEDGLVDTLGAARRGAIIKRRIEPIAKQTPSA